MDRGCRSDRRRGYAVLPGEQLGWDYRVLGVGGSGYTARRCGHTFDKRIDRAVDGPDVVVVQGSLNERTVSRSSLAAAALATLGQLRSAVDPETAVLVVGASYTPGTGPAAIDWINDAIGGRRAARAAVRRPGGRELDRPGRPAIWADPNHPNDAGYQLHRRPAGLRLASLLAG